LSYYASLTARWQRPEDPALSGVVGELTYGALEQLARRGAAWLGAQGLKAGDVLALQLPRGLPFLTLHLAALRCGVATLPLNERATVAELRFLLEDAAPALAILASGPPLEGTSRWSELSPDAAWREILKQPPATEPPVDDPDALALLCYTSGTTGRPKGARLLHRHLQATVEALHEAWRWRREDVLVHALPLFHIHGLIVAQHGAWWAGARCVHLDGFDADAVLHTLEAEHATVFMGVPTFYHRLLASTRKADLGGVRLFTSGSAPLPELTHRGFAARYGHAILERYGMTEVGIVLSNPYAGERRPGSVGLPLPGVEVRIVQPDVDLDLVDGEVGELLIRGPSVFDGYHRQPEATSRALRDGWMHTGDLGLRDANGYVHLRGRRSELVICGGFNVYPSEVEEALREHAHVDQAAVVGLPDLDLGEVTAASVVLVPGAQTTPATLRNFLRARLSGYKVPRHLEVVAELPRNALGKVRKDLLRARWIDQLADASTEHP
jgi:malonyl-CoA/methylmalonyl-CoA synthetase